MAPEEESKPETSPHDAAGPKPPMRRDRRPGRGRRGHGRGGRVKRAPSETGAAPVAGTGVAPQEAEPIFELAEEPNQPADFRSDEPEATEAPPEPIVHSTLGQKPQPASSTSVENAIEEVSTIVETLRGALDDMEEVLELLEVFERQKNADEREIDSLRRALRQVHRPRDAGHHPHR